MDAAGFMDATRGIESDVVGPTHASLGLEDALGFPPGTLPATVVRPMQPGSW